MNRVYEFAIRIQDMMSPTLARMSATYNSTVSNMDRQTTRIQSSFSRAGQSVEQLRRRLNFGREAMSVDNLRTRFDSFARSVQSGFSRAVQSVDQLRRRLNFGSEIRNVDTLAAHLDGLTRRRNISVNGSEIRQLNREIQATEREMQRLQRMGAGGSRSMIGGFMSSQVGGMLTGAALLAAGGAFFNQGIQREQTQIAYEQFTRDKDKAAKLIAAQNRFADVTPFSNEEVMGAGRNLLSYGFKTEDITRHEQIVGDVAAGVQTNFGELTAIYGKLKSKGFADTSDIWQFADRGIPILDALSKSLGKSKEEVLKMAETRKIRFSDIENAFTSLTGKGGQFEGMLDKMSKTTGGKLSTLMGTIQNKVGMMAQALNPVVGMLLDVGSGLFAALDPVFTAIMNLFSAFDPLFQAIGRLLAVFGISSQQTGLLTIVMQGLALVINGVAFVVNILGQAINFLVSNPVSAFIVAAGLIIMNLGTIVGWLGMLVGWLSTAVSWILAAARAWWAANAAMLACPAVWIVAAIAAIVAGVVWLWDNCEGFRHALIRLWEVAKAVFGSIGKAWNALMKGDFEGVGKAFSEGIKKGMANADVRIKADKASRAAAGAPKVPAAPKAQKPGMPQAPGAGGPGGAGGGAGGDKKNGGVGKAAGVDGTTGGTKSTTITINLKSLVEKLTIHASGVQDGLNDAEAQVTDTLLRVLNSANAMDT